MPISDPRAFQAVAIKRGLEMWMKHKLRVNSAYTPSAMLRTASNITGQKFKPRDYAGAVDALNKWLHPNFTKDLIVSHTTDSTMMDEIAANMNADAEQPAPPGETPAAAFKRLATARVNVAIKRIQLLGNLSNRSSYEYTDAQIEKIFGVMQAELDAAKKRFQPRASDKPLFSLDD